METNELSTNCMTQVSSTVETQTAELKKAILSNPNLKDTWEKSLADPMNEGEDWDVCADVIYSLWGICVGMEGEDGNCYDYGAFSHEQIVSMLKSY